MHASVVKRSYLTAMTTLIAFMWLLFLMLGADALSSKSTVAFRPASAADVSFARKTMLQQAMNPLSISEQTLLVAYDDDTQDLVGFGQIRPLSAEYAELASLFVLPEKRKQGIGSSLVDALLERFDSQKEKGPFPRKW
jgi:ribosomal protein S18 acetylase RimI-like enzyme